MPAQTSRVLHVKVATSDLLRIQSAAKNAGVPVTTLARDLILSNLDGYVPKRDKLEDSVMALSAVVAEMRTSTHDKLDLAIALSASSVTSAALLKDNGSDPTEVAQMKFDGHLQQALTSSESILRLRDEIIASSASARPASKRR